MICSILPSDMPSAVSITGPRRHRPLVGVDVAVGQQVQALVEHLPVESSHGRPILPRSRRTSSTVPASCISHTSRFLRSVTCAPSPCGPALPVARLAGRYSCDYYGHSVAIGLASLRRSHVHQRYTFQRDLGVPFVSLNTRTGHRSSTPEDYHRLLQPAAGAGTGYRRLSGGCPFAPSGDWDSGNPAFAISRGSPGTPPQTPEPGCRFPGMLLSPLPLGSRSAIRSRDNSSHLCPLRGRYNAAPRGAPRSCAAQ